MLSARILVGHHTVGGGDDRNSETVEYLGDVVALGINAETRLGDALDSCDNRTLFSSVFQSDGHLLVDAFPCYFIFGDITQLTVQFRIDFNSEMFVVIIPQTITTIILN